MICAFSNLDDLNDALLSLPNGLQRDSLRLFKAESSTDEKIGFYGIAFSGNIDQKITVSADSRNLEELIDSFPLVKRDTITTIWKSQNNWTGCFDVLSSLVQTHNRMMLDDSSNLLTDLVWPAIAAPGGCSTHGDWSVQKLSSALDSAHIGASLPIADGWVDILQVDNHPYEEDYDEEEEEGDSQHMDVVDVPIVSFEELHGVNGSGGFSYRDALLRAPPPEEDSSPAFTVLTAATTTRAGADWKPSFVVSTASKRRIDKVYVSSTAGGGAAADDCDDDPLSEYYESQAFVKGMVSLTRTRAITKMRPAALEQKLKRIAEKTAAGHK